jgi:predicted ATPase/class 3 adenylate cyclase
MPRATLPTGTVTFLFTDIEGSTVLLSELGERYDAILADHAVILRRAIAEHGGSEVNTEGDAFFAVFPFAPGAVRAAAQAQLQLTTAGRSVGTPILVRMGLHTGEGKLGGDDYVGMDVHRAARIAAAGHGGQVLLSDATRALVAHDLPAGVALRDMAQHRLKDLPAPEHLWQLEIDGLPADFQALRSLDARPNNLPLSATPLIGREAELEEVRRLLGQRRLVTLTGPGGTGKTRLALAAGHQLLADFADGAFFIPLQNAQDRATVASEIAAALGVREKQDRDLEQGVIEHLREREELLVLDNFEQVLSAVPLVAELLASSARLRIIVTSRSALHVSGEQEFGVPPLRLPDPRDLPPLAALSQYEAVALFIERARAVKSDFEVTNENAPAVAEICSRLDGLPLAIELAAARVKLLSPDQILARLDRSVPVLTGGARDLPDRQRTLHGAIDWSHELLDEPERALFARLSAFAGGWTLEAADSVCNPAGELDIDTFDGLASLADKSLVRPAHDGDVEPRFDMLQVIREFAAEKLEAREDGEAVRRRHATRMLALAVEAEPRLVRSGVRQWQERLRREEENLRTALRWAVDHEEAEIGMATAGALWRFWHYWAEVREGRGWLEAMLALPQAAAPARARAKALCGLAGLLYWQGDPGRAGTLYEEALSIYRSMGDDALIAETLHASAWTAAARNDFGSASAYAQEAQDRYRMANDPVGVANISTWLINGAYFMGAGGSAEAALEASGEALKISLEHGRTYDALDWIGSQGLIYLRIGDIPRAIEANRTATRLWYEIRHVGMLPWVKVLAHLELQRGNVERAVRLGAIAERAVEEMGGELTEAMSGIGNPLDKARKLLPEEQFGRAREEGRAMNIDQAVAYALADPAD